MDDERTTNGGAAPLHADEREHAYAEALHQTALAAMRRLDPSEVLETIVTRAAALAGAAHGYAYLRDATTDELEVRCGVGVFTEWIGYRLRVGEGMAGRVMATGSPLLVDRYDSWEGRSETFPPGLIGSVVGVPLTAGDELVGVIGLAHVDDRRRFTPQDAEVLSKFAEIASVALDNASLHAALRAELQQRERTEAELTHMAFHDGLTNLPNRAMFEELLSVALARARREGRAVAVLYLDLDNFKVINDGLGHAAGDELLRRLADRLRAAVRGSDVVARHGGDEFLVLLADLQKRVGARTGGSPLATAEQVAARIREQLAEPFRFDRSEVFVTASIGISAFPVHAGDATTLLRYADVAMYTCKRTDPGGVRVFSGEDPVGRRSLVSRVRRAVEQGSWVLHYQPIVDLDDGTVRGVEALIRWPQSGGRLIGPNTFIPLVEEMGLAGILGDWVLEHVCRQVRAWREAGAGFYVSFNVSLPELWQPNLVPGILDRVGASGASPTDLVIEITEATAMSDPERTQQTLEDLHAEGFRIALDDFGSGYSSLSRLKELPADILKIDRPFLRGVPEDASASSSLGAVIQMAQGLGMQPLAEGVETEGQRRYLMARGCRTGQGFYFAQALPPEEITASLRAGALRVTPHAAPA